MSLITNIENIKDGEEKFNLIESFYKRAYLLELQKEHIINLLKNTSMEDTNSKEYIEIMKTINKMEI